MKNSFSKSCLGKVLVFGLTILAPSLQAIQNFTENVNIGTTQNNKSLTVNGASNFNGKVNRSCKKDQAEKCPGKAHGVFQDHGENNRYQKKSGYFVPKPEFVSRMDHPIFFQLLQHYLALHMVECESEDK